MCDRSINVHGYIGSVFISFTLLPQIVHTFRKKKVDQLSPIFLLNNFVGTFFMMVYAVQETLVPIIVTNAMILTFTITLTILYMCFKSREVAEVAAEGQGQVAEGQVWQADV